jgi:nucleotide-binding universal stress UspA family protein
VALAQGETAAPSFLAESAAVAEELGDRWRRAREIMTRAQFDFESECCGVFRGLGVAHEPVIERGDPRRCLIETAQAEEAGLIVVGQRGAGQFDGLGGTASYLVRHSPLPLAIIPPPPDQ